MDLVYGHLGTPFYDTASKTWHFARDPLPKRYFHPICQLWKDVVTEQHDPAKPQAQRELHDAYPYLGGSAYLEDARLSDLVSNSVEQYDSTVSDLVAYGNAVDSTHQRSYKQLQFMQIVVAAGGAAGELIRLIALNRKRLKWINGEKVGLEVLTAQGGDEGWWKGNGSPIQQMVFAGDEKQASTWLAVRYQSAISILWPTLRFEMVCPSNAAGQIRELPASRIDPNHVVTLTSQDAGGTQFADVTFNPWNFQQFATLDQGCHWHVWNMHRQSKAHALWKVEKFSSGHGPYNENIDESPFAVIPDGWARLLWIKDPHTLVIAGRRYIAMINIDTKLINLEIPDLGLSKSSDWILDLRRTPASTDHLLVLTSSRLILLNLSPSAPEVKSPGPAATLVSWIHFRSPKDISLSMSSLGLGEPREASQTSYTTALVVYSRLNGLAMIYKFQYSHITRGMSTFDPCLLPLAERCSKQSQGRSHGQDTQHASRPLSLQMMPVLAMSTRVHKYNGAPEEQRTFYLLRVLYHDKSMSEHLYLESRHKMHSLTSPDTQTFVGLQKTPARVNDDFIVPDGVIDDNQAADPISSGATAHSNSVDVPKQPKMTFSDTMSPIDQSDPRTIEMGWLVKLINEQSRSSRSQPIEECLDIVEDAVNEKLSAARSGAETFLELSDAKPLVADIDNATTTLGALLKTFPWSSANTKKADDSALDRSTLVLRALPQAMSPILGIHSDMNLPRVYESLVASQIGPLSLKTPSRLRIAIEKQVRSLAAQLCFAAYTVHIRMEVPDPRQPTEHELSTQDSTFSVPVRDKGAPVSASEKDGKVPKQPTSQMPASASSLEPSGPSFMLSGRVRRSGRPNKSLHPTMAGTTLDDEMAPEDTSSINLRSLVPLAPQPQLPPRLSNILCHWSIGEDPDTYDWTAAQRATAPLDSEAVAAEQARLAKAAKRAKKRARFDTLVGKRDASHARATEEGVHTQPEPQMAMMEPSSQVLTMASSSQMMPESSQMGAAISSQPLPGRFAGGQKGLKGKRGKRKGF